MANQLRQVLQTFENNDASLSMTDMVRQLDVTPAMLEGMIQHWVRKGKLREVLDCQTESCGSCGSDDNCPFVGSNPPRRYELVKDDIVKIDDVVGGCAKCG